MPSARAKPLAAGRLNRRVRIEAPTRTQDPNTGAITDAWTTLASVYASIEPLSARDFIAAQSIKSKVSTRVVIRYRAGLTTAMRLVGDDGTIYTPQGFLPDADSGKEYLTIPCSTTN